MKKFYLLFSMTACFLAADAQTIFTYGSNAVSKDEFLRAYNKNSTTVTDKEKSIREYLELYSNFKLKVKAAEELKLDTLPQIKYDVQNFRRQVEENYMSDEKGSAKLMGEAFERSQKDIHVTHFSIAVDANATADDTLRAYRNITAVYDALQGGSKDYDVIAQKNGAKNGDLGFITAFSVPYAYENIIYGLKPGQVSKPYRSKSAWHIFKVEEERKSAGKWKIAQLLFSFPPDATPEQKQAIQKKADSVYALLQHSADFGEMAKMYSDDKLTYMTGGELPEFGTGKFDPSFEKQVFSLKKDGDISKPFLSSFGVHIVKRLSFTATPTEKDNAALQYELKQKLMQDSRINNAKEQFAKAIVVLTALKKTNAVKDADLFRYADSVGKDPSTDHSAQYPISKKTVISFKSEEKKGADWLKFVRDYKLNPEQYKGETYPELWNKFTTYSALEYYRKHLEDYNEDFRFQMKEFREGNMLFEIMERNVWSKAANDSAGLLNYYNANKQHYKWAASADVIIINAANEKAATDAIAQLKAGASWKDLAEKSNGSMQADSGRYELSQIVEQPNLNTVVEGTYSTIIKNVDGTATFVKFLHKYPVDQQRSFEEAKGLVINDYQTVLEKQWLNSLQKKYPVKVNEAVVKQVIN